MCVGAAWRWGWGGGESRDRATRIREEDAGSGFAMRRRVNGRVLEVAQPAFGLAGEITEIRAGLS